MNVFIHTMVQLGVNDQLKFTIGQLNIYNFKSNGSLVNYLSYIRSVLLTMQESGIYLFCSAIIKLNNFMMVMIQ